MFETVQDAIGAGPSFLLTFETAPLICKHPVYIDLKYENEYKYFGSHHG